jgi:DNA-binding PadR family transcriptional regulator
MDKNELDLMVLGALVLGPAHGYELKKRITDMFGPIYPNLSNSVIYPRLAQFQKEVYINCKVESQEKAPNRKVYWLMDAGLKRVKELTASPIRLIGQVQSTYTDELTVHIVFFNLVSKDERRRVIEPYYAFTQQRFDENVTKLEKYSAILDKYNLALLEYAVSMLRGTLDLYRRLMEM